MARYLITGATRGIGRALVDLLVPAHELIALGRSSPALQQLPVARTIVADLADPGALAGLVPTYTHLDGLIHCAAIAQRGNLADTDVLTWSEHLTLNVVAPAQLTRLVLPALRAAGGTVVFVNSVQGLVPRANSTVYATTKSALRALADTLRGEEPLLRVSSIYPGFVATGMQQALRQQEGRAYEPDKYIRPETVAQVIAQVLATPPDASITDVTLMHRPA